MVINVSFDWNHSVARQLFSSVTKILQSWHQHLQQILNTRIRKFLSWGRKNILSESLQNNTNLNQNTDIVESCMCLVPRQSFWSSCLKSVEPLTTRVSPPVNSVAGTKQSLMRGDTLSWGEQTFMMMTNDSQEKLFPRQSIFC